MSKADVISTTSLTLVCSYVIALSVIKSYIMAKNIYLTCLNHVPVLPPLYVVYHSATCIFGMCYMINLDIDRIG